MTAPVLSVRGLSVAYESRGRRIPAVSDLDLTIEPGQTVVLVGESGSGKSTTAAAIVRVLAVNAQIGGGSIEIAGLDVLRLADRAARRTIGRTVGYVPQDPTVSLNPVKTVGAQVAEPLRVHLGFDRRRAAARTVEILGEVGLDRPAERARQYPHELSGGMRQRVLIAAALAAQPKLVVADEPTSGLDVTIQKLLLDQLSELAAKGLSILLITHDLGVARDRADRVLVMSRGRIVESGPVEQIFSEPADPYTRQLLAAAPSLNRRRLTGRGPVTRPLAAANESPLLEARGLTKLFNVGRGAASEPLRALEDVDLSIKRGSSLGVVGESGSGKTTLARIVADLTPPTSGDVVFDGARLSDLGRSERRGRRRRVQYVYQNPFVSLDPRFKVAEIIDEPLRSFRVGTRRSRQGRVRELLDLVALPADFAARRPGELSGGQRQRVAIARALALSPELLVLDEPVSALDVSVQAQVLQLLADLQHQLGLTYLFISHDLAVIRLVADEVAVLSGGRVVESGPTAQVLSAPSDDYTRRLLDAIPGRARATNPTPAKR